MRWRQFCLVSDPRRLILVFQRKRACLHEWGRPSASDWREGGKEFVSEWARVDLAALSYNN